jgi:hypothetical protein
MINEIIVHSHLKSLQELDIRTQNIFKTIQQLMSTAHHYKTYRETLDSLQPPGVPVQGS